MSKYEFKVISDFDLKLLNYLKKLEVLNLGKKAALNEWQLPVWIRYGKFFVIINEQKEIIGVCQAMRVWDDINTAFIHSFYINKNYRRKKIGKTLLKFVIDYFQSNGLKKIKLTVDSKNMAAMNLYKKAGFEVEHLLKDEYGKGKSRLLMVLTI